MTTLKDKVLNVLSEIENLPIECKDKLLLQCNLTEFDFQELKTKANDYLADRSDIYECDNCGEEIIV